MIEVRGMSKFFGDFKALDDINIQIGEGSVYGLLGSNGAGKTTLIKHIAGIYKQDSGTVMVKGVPIYENAGLKSHIVYIPDELFFFSGYSTEETAEFYSGLYPHWNWERYHTLKQIFTIDTGKKISRLSRGMQKQVAFWLGICTMPHIMLLDEPMDGLDPVTRKKVWNLVLQDVAEHGTTILIASHNLRELEDVCDHIGILHEGKIVVEKELDNIKSGVHKLQAAFSGEIPDGFMQGEQVLHQSQAGAVLLLIIKGDRDKIEQRAREYNPVLLDILPLTLEEIFIYELGGIGYDIKNIII